MSDAIEYCPTCETNVACHMARACQSAVAHCAVAPGSAACPECKGDGWLKGEWDECISCYGTGRKQSREWRANMRVMRAEENLRACERVLSRARIEAKAAASELVAARQALPNT